tara:strand:+ start:648 stop:947 length:300 start_codon:yes stop_codon:yes gene_type:complete
MNVTKLKTGEYKKYRQSYQSTHYVMNIITNIVYEFKVLSYARENDLAETLHTKLIVSSECLRDLGIVARTPSHYVATKTYLHDDEKTYGSNYLLHSIYL